MNHEIRPCGRLKEILEEFNAPKDAQICVARVVGALVPNSVPYRDVIETIEYNEDERIEHDWDKICDTLRMSAHRVYEGKEPFK